MVKELTAEQVRLQCTPTVFKCDSTEELRPKDGIIGQDRALSALKFGLNIAKAGFNVYVSGSAGTGRTTAIKSFMEAVAARKETPSDWCYVYNFHDSYCPHALGVPVGMGETLRQDMEVTIANVRRSLVQNFTSKEYAQRREGITEDFNKKRATVFKILEKKAREKGFILEATPVGVIFVPAADGEPMSEEAYNSLDTKEKEALKKKQDELTDELKEQIARLTTEQSAIDKQLEDTDREVAGYSIRHLFEKLREKYGQLPQVVTYLKEVEQDIVANFEQFRAEPKAQDGDPMAAMREMAQKQALRKYEVNLLVDNSGVKGAPVILELNPTFNNLLGRIEKEAQFGALSTDFTMIKGGSLHHANGGYLVLRIEDILSNFQSWEGLKRTLRDGKLAIEELGERLGYVVTKSLRPEPIPLEVKVVLIGEPKFYYLLLRLDPDFKELSSGALAQIIEHSSRLAGDQKKLSALFADIADILREASFWAEEDKAKHIEGRHVEKAIEEKVYRSNLIQQRINEMIDDGMIMIDAKGEKVGQVNGLAVIDLGDFAFGRPSRITASAGLGREGLIDIEREAKLGGRLHTKGVMILNGYITDRYVGDIPLSLSARLVFEQSYDEVEGDSASSTELYAILSRLADAPIKQGIAVTGSVNQKGEVQAIGGINEKIEGFFEVCRAKGLNGEQGALIPASNVRNLMLKEEVAAAVKEGKFHVYPVSTIDQGIEVLTGVKAGKRRQDGSFTPGSINDLVQKRLASLAEKLRDFTRGEEKEEKAEGSGK